MTPDFTAWFKCTLILDLTYLIEKVHLPLDGKIRGNQVQKNPHNVVYVFVSVKRRTDKISVIGNWLWSNIGNRLSAEFNRYSIPDLFFRTRQFRSMEDVWTSSRAKTFVHNKQWTHLISPTSGKLNRNVIILSLILNRTRPGSTISAIKV